MNNQSILTPREKYERNYKGARSNLLMMLLFTAVNIVLCLFKSSSYFVFSAQIPYTMVYDSMWTYGMMPAEAYWDTYGLDKADLIFPPQSMFYVMVAIAVVIVALYLLCYIFSGKKVGWMTFALVLFVLDCVGMGLLYAFYYVFDASMILDLLFHVLVLYYLILGVIAGHKLRKMPEQLPAEPVADTDADAE